MRAKSKTMSRTGILSDYHIMKHCAVFSPIPMNMAKKVLHQDLNIHTVSPFTTKKLKYSNPVSRPASFNTLADSLTRIGGGDVRIKEHLVESFIHEIENGNGSEYSNGSESVHSDSNTVSTDDGVRLPDDPRRSDDDLARRLTIPRLSNEETLRRLSVNSRAFESPDVSDDDEPLSPTDITASGYRRGQLNGAQMYAIREDSSVQYGSPEYNRMLAQAAGASGLNY